MLWLELSSALATTEQNPVGLIEKDIPVVDWEYQTFDAMSNTFTLVNGHC